MKSHRPSLCVAGALAASLALTSWLQKQRRRTRRYEIAEQSMGPALLPGDYVLARRSGATFLLGDIVIYPHPSQPDLELVKRVVGLPGTTVTIDRGTTMIDGAVLPEPWAEPDPADDGVWHVARDEIFVMGDQRRRSSGDSRRVGPLPVSQVPWTVRARYWPPRRIGWL